MSDWYRAGDGWLWLNAAAVASSLLAVIGLIALIAYHGLAYFWPGDVVEITLAPGAAANASADRSVEIGEIFRAEQLTRERFLAAGGDPQADTGPVLRRWLVRTGARRLDPPDFRWLFEHQTVDVSRPPELAVFERTEWGPVYGRPLRLLRDGAEISRGTAAWVEFSKRLGGHTGASSSASTGLFTLVVDLGNDRNLSLPAGSVIRTWRPNAMSSLEKVAHFASSVWRFLREDPREANTEGGVFPALFGTVLVVLLMTVLVTPLGVLAALYLHEYAGRGPLVTATRIAVNNLAGVPSIVYGVFGLGFFVYLFGGNLDRLFFEDRLPAPTFGTPGVLWASLTLALLTLPVVVVSTEEGLRRIPSALRDGSLALGATRAETLWRVSLPLATPSILTGVILAIARAAGEVAPLMLVGVVKLAPALPVDGSFPFLHLERKFMHLGFHIYDVGFQSPNAEAARPLVFASALLLILIIITLNLAAVLVRNRLENRYRSVEID